MLKLSSMALFQVGNCERWIVSKHTKEMTEQQSDRVGGRNQLI